MSGKMVLVQKFGTGWNGFKQWNSDAVEIIEWLANHGYKAYRTGTTAAGKRVCYFKKPGCKTEYAIHC